MHLYTRVREVREHIPSVAVHIIINSAHYKFITITLTRTRSLISRRVMLFQEHIRTMHKLHSQLTETCVSPMGLPSEQIAICNDV